MTARGKQIAALSVEPAGVELGRAIWRGRSKFGATPTWVDGIRFASKRESARYSELKLLEAAGEITDLALQVPYTLWATDMFTANGPFAKVGKYVADFVYLDRMGKTHVEDAKGMRTPLYRWKCRHFELQHAGLGLRIEEV